MTTTERPTRLRGPRNGAPDGREFPWGPIDTIHDVGDITVLEYREDNSNNGSPSTWSRHGRTLFHVYVGDRDTSHSYESLDSALVGAIAYKRRGPNSQAAQHFDLMTLGVIPGQEDR